MRTVIDSGGGGGDEPPKDTGEDSGLLGGISDAIDEAYQGGAQQLDAVAGSTDEAVGRATESAGEGDVAGVYDHLYGSTDEAVGRGISDAKKGDVAGVFDNLAGGTDEAVGRAASAAEEGDTAGVLDNLAGGLDEAAGEYYQGFAQQADAAAGSVDESVGRQFDKETGGGLADETVEATKDVAEEAASAADDAVDAANDVILSELFENPVLLGIVALVALYVFGQGFDVGVNQPA